MTSPSKQRGRFACDLLKMTCGTGWHAYCTCGFMTAESRSYSDAMESLESHWREQRPRKKAPARDGPETQPALGQQGNLFVA